MGSSGAWRRYLLNEETKDRTFEQKKQLEPFMNFFLQDASHFGSASLSMLASQCSKVTDPTMVYGHQDAMKNPYMSAWGMPAGNFQ